MVKMTAKISFTLTLWLKIPKFRNVRMNFIHTNVTLLLKIPKFPHFGSTLKNKIIKVFLGMLE